MDSSLLSYSGTSASTNEENEYIWDGYTQGGADNPNVSLNTAAGNGYYEDLELAARLGKTLLEKNKELETTNYQLKYANDEQALEIDHLSKQLVLLRDINDSKSRMCEQLDFANNDLECINRELKREVKELKERLTRSCDTCEQQEEHMQNLRRELDSLKSNQEKKKRREKLRRRTIHSCLPSTEVAALLEFLENSTSEDFTASLHESLLRDNKPTDTDEIEQLRELVSNLKAQQKMDKRKVGEVKAELELLMHENQEYIERLQEEKCVNQKLNQIIEEYEQADFNKDFSSHNLSDEIANAELNFSSRNEIEFPHVEDVTNDSAEQSANLKNLHNSLPPIEQYLKITNSTPVKSSSSSDSSGINIDLNCVEDKSENLLQVKKESKNVSLVQELDTQYKTLLEKYERLLDSIHSEKDEKSVSKNLLQNDPNQNSQISSSRIESKSMVSREQRSDCPEYKRLFQEIFSILNKVKSK